MHAHVCAYVCVCMCVCTRVCRGRVLAVAPHMSGNHEGERVAVGVSTVRLAFEGPLPYGEEGDPVDRVTAVLGQGWK